MKAYIVQHRYDPMFSTVVFAKTAGKARALAQRTDVCRDFDFTDIRVLRKPALDKFYRGKFEMDWYNDEDRIAMVRFANFACSMEVDNPECGKCPAKEWCYRYEEIIKNYERNI